MYLRDVDRGDLDVYARMRCDPAMMVELGGPLPLDGIEAKLQRDIADVTADRAWISMIVDPGGDAAPTRRSATVGSVVLWSHDEAPEPSSEIGWMILPAFQGRGVGKAAARLMLDRARQADRWGLIHAFPGVTNRPSNAICRSLGFALLDQREVEFSGRMLVANHWVINPMDGLVTADHSAVGG
jgi:RimJ/RimL family protein N-acetyltransferase